MSLVLSYKLSAGQCYSYLRSFLLTVNMSVVDLLDMNWEDLAGQVEEDHAVQPASDTGPLSEMEPTSHLAPTLPTPNEHELSLAPSPKETSKSHMEPGSDPKLGVVKKRGFRGAMASFFHKK